MNGGFLKTNWAYLVWFIIYFVIAWYLFGHDWLSFGFVLVTYAISIGLALSPIGEVLLRFIQGAKLVQT